MAFGQLQIFRPDGPVETVILEGETIGIGRSPGNFLVLDSNGVSRYHVTLATKEGQVYLQDLESVNGTYVDGLPLQANDPRLLRGGEEIQIGDVRLVFQPMVDLDITVEHNTQTLETDQILLELEGPDMAVTPGTHIEARLNITNRTNEAVRYKVSVEGAVTSWTRIDRRELEIPAGEKREIRINFKPRRHSDSKPGEYDFTIRVVDTNNERTPFDLKSRLHLLKFSGYGVALGSSTIEGDTPFQMFIHNQGNAPLSLDFRGESPGSVLQFAINPPSLVLGAGERRTVNGLISPKTRPFIGGKKEYRFDIISHANDASGFQAPISGAYLALPTIPLWGAIAGLGTLILSFLLISIIFIAFLGNEENPSPTASATPTVLSSIVSFQSNITETDVSMPFFITWDTENAEIASLVIMREGVEMATYALPSVDGTNYPVTIPSAGRYTVALTTDDQVSSEIVIFVKPTITLKITTSEEDIPGADSPAILYRNLAQVVTISWNIVWSDNPESDPRPAPTVILDSPRLGYEQQMVSLTSPAQQITISPSGIDSIIVNLLTNGPDNIQASLKQEISIVNPMCATVNESTDIYDGPGSTGYPLLLSIEPTELRVDSKNEDGTWVHVYIPPQSIVQREMGWVRAEDLQCEFDLINLESIINYPPPATPVPIPNRSGERTPVPTRLPTTTPSLQG